MLLDLITNTHYWRFIMTELKRLKEDHRKGDRDGDDWEMAYKQWEPIPRPGRPYLPKRVDED